MQAMDAELARSRAQPSSSSRSSEKAEGSKGTDIEAAMDAELKAALERGFDDDDDVEFANDSQSTEYNLIKNLLESFKSQAGLSGPVGNLAGRLQPDWQIPRDEA
jgi:hypothetical protein